jgi:hypothetical protein
VIPFADFSMVLKSAVIILEGFLGMDKGGEPERVLLVPGSSHGTFC